MDGGVDKLLLSLTQNVTGNGLCWSVSEFAVESD
jgi:hypothetical protein